MKEIIAHRIGNARKLRGLSMQEVAQELGVSKQMISKYEKGLSMPNSTKLINLSKLFGLKIDYFFSPFKIELGEINFRKRSSFSAKRQNSLKEQIKIKLENYLYIEDSLSIDSTFLNPIKDITISSIKDVEYAVAQLRDKWDIGSDPVHNIIQLLEDKKIKIVEIDDIDNKFDGLATYADNKYPIIVLNTTFPVERKRFSLLHELGHLLLNISKDSELKEEKLCDKFASEFLIPKDTLLKEFGGKRKHITFSELISIQEKYGVSIKAIIYKLNDIGIVTDSQNTSFYNKIKFNRSLEKEIDQSRFSTPECSNRYNRLVYQALARETISISKASSLLNVGIDDIKENYELI